MFVSQTTELPARPNDEVFENNDAENLRPEGYLGSNLDPDTGRRSGQLCIPVNHKEFKFTLTDLVAVFITFNAAYFAIIYREQVWLNDETL